MPFRWATPAEIAARNQTQVLGGTGITIRGLVVIAVTTRDPLAGRNATISVVDQLLAELRSDNDWENPTLDRYLEAFGALLGSIENHYMNTGQQMPDDPWAIVAEVLRGARYYE